MIYCDASVLVALVAPERFTAAAIARFEGVDPKSLAYSAWTSVEVASALARKERSRALDRAGRVAAELAWSALARDMTPVAIGLDEFSRAATLVDAGPRGLRAGDALQLAVVLARGLPLATLDRDLADAAEAVGAEVALRPPA